ncbi:MAG TPA: porin family protein [Adhaeribacter sp.]|nr:porin family protein [Adhaeribacter sp.]
MKKVFLLFLGLTMSVCTMAQNTRVTTKAQQNHNLLGGSPDNNGGFGIKGGVNFNMLRGADKSKLQNLNNETTWHAGVFAQFPVAGSDFFSIQGEALFSRKSFTSDDSISTKYKMDYVDVPLLFVFNVLDNVSFHVGPYASLLLTVQENDSEVGEAQKKLLNSFGYGLAGGVEAKISFARVGARYNLGLNDIYKTPKMIGNESIQDLKNGNFQVYVGVGFR